jgi:WD40 repeat protein
MSPPRGSPAPLAAGIVQVLNGAGAPAGAGFVAGQDVVLTCAHVVIAAGGGPGRRVRLRFPQLDGTPQVQAEVLPGGWRKSEDQDIAVLRIDDLPPGAEVLPLGAAAGCRGHAVRSFGFPAQAVTGGHHGYGKAGDLLRPGPDAGVLLQVSDANDLTQGFSGGPVLDDKTGLVVGMLTAITRVDVHSRGSGIAYATATETLREAWPALRVRDLCPYRGLEQFTAEHADWFHGRAGAVERVLTALATHPPALLLLGPSGAGKSSLIQAGVLPALANGALPGSDRRAVLVTRPGSGLRAGLQRLAASAAETSGSGAGDRPAGQAPGGRLVLVLDQFEELLTPPAAAPAGLDDAHHDVLRELAEAIGTPGPSVVLLMRDDFYPRLAALAPDLLNAVAAAMVNIPATLTSQDLHDVITRPADAVGARCQDGLAERIISDVLTADPQTAGPRHAPTTVLPLLEVTLQQLWQRRDDGQLTHHAYERIGGVTGSLATWCDAVIDRLPHDQRLTAQRVLTALVRPADTARGIPAVRQRLPIATLNDLAHNAAPTSDGQTGGGQEADHAIDQVLATLTTDRIIITGTTTLPDGTPDQPVAELIHDALIRDWATLRGWVEQDHRFQDWLRRADERRARSTRRDTAHPDDLLAGSDLAEGLDWAQHRRLPHDTATFLAASHHRQRARTRRARQVTLALAVALVVALAGAGVALRQRQNAVAAQQVAVDAQQLALSRQLAAQSTTVVATDPDLASLLAVAAYRTRPTTEATASLYAAAALPLEHRLAGHAGPVDHLVFAERGNALATLDGNDIARLWNTRSGRLLATLTGKVHDAAFSPDGKMLATGGADGTVRLWNAGNGQTRAALTGHTGLVGKVAFSPDGRILATGGEDRAVRLWDAGDGRLRATLRGHPGAVTDLTFARDGRTLVTGSFDYSADDTGVRLWDVAKGRPGPALAGDVTPADLMMLSPDGRLLAAGADDGTVGLWTTADGRLRATLTGHTGPVTDLQFSPDGRTLATGSFGTEAADGTVRLWNPATASRGRVLSGHHSSMAFSPDSRTLATADDVNAVRLWDPRTGKSRATLTGLDGIHTLAFSPDGRTLATGTFDGAVTLWDPDSKRLRATLPGRTPWLNTMIFSPDGLALATAGNDGAARLWDADAGRPRRTLQGDADLATVVFSPDGRALITADRAGSARSWDTGTGRPRPALAPRGDTVTAVTLSPDGASVAVASSSVLGDDSTIRLWDIAGRRLRATLVGHAGTAYTVLFTRDGRTLASWSLGAEDGDGLVRLWDAADGRLRATLFDQPDDAETATAAAFSPDGRTLATGSSAGDDLGRVRLWDAGSGKLRAAPAGRPGLIYDVAFSPDGRTLASGDSDGVVQLWNVADGKRGATLTGHTDTVNNTVFSPDGRILASGSGDGTVRLWDVAGGQPIGTLTGHVQGVDVVMFSPDGRILASGGADGAVRLWDLTSRQLLTGFAGHNARVTTLAISPDGRALASVADGAVRLWDMPLSDPPAAVRKVCQAVARDLSAVERQLYLPSDQRSASACPTP